MITFDNSTIILFISLSFLYVLTIIGFCAYTWTAFYDAETNRLDSEKAKRSKNASISFVTIGVIALIFMAIFLIVKTQKIKSNE